MNRRTLILAVIAATVIASATTASAGGSVWLFEESEYQPGDVAESTTSVAWGHDSSLGTPEDGPYLIYLAPIDASATTWPGIPDAAMLVGIVEIHLGTYRAEDGDLYGPHHAVARIEMPDAAPGEYQIFHCNDPCTKTLGDLIGGWGITVVAGSGGRPPAEIAEEIRNVVGNRPIWIDHSPEPIEPADDWRIGAIALSALLILLSTVLVLRWRVVKGGPRPTTPDHQVREHDTPPVESVIFELVDIPA